jgi:predicted MFS family arabinose efflux permease
MSKGDIDAQFFPTATNLGPILGPVIGGPLANKAGWRWVFWFLTILGSAFVLAVLLFLPETCRSIVGNGSIPARGWSRHWVSYVFDRPHKNAREGVVQPTEASLPMMKRLAFILPNPWKSLRLLFEKDTALVLSVSAIFYTAYYIVQASIPALLQRTYGLNETAIGLCYFAIGTGVAAGGYLNGMVSCVCCMSQYGL